MKIHDIIIDTIHEFLNENVQLADKEYFRTGILSQEDKDFILSITHGDNYTKLITDFYNFLTKHDFYNRTNIPERLKLLYENVKTYNKNVFPIIGYDTIKVTNVFNIINSLENRRKIINELKKLPSFAIRNLKTDIRQPRNGSELSDYLYGLQYFMSHYSLLSNRSEEVQMKFAKKMFKSDTTLNDLMNFVDDKASFLGGVEITRDDVIRMSKEEDFEVIYEQGQVMIVRVDSPDGIKKIGCNSLWCFTYGNGFDSAYRNWNNYSYNNMVYVIIDFREANDSENFMHVLIKPLTNENGRLIKYDVDNGDSPIYNMSNENYNDPYSILNYFFGKNARKIIKNYLNFNY